MRAGVIFLKNRIEFAIRRAARCERRREQGAEVERPRFQSWWRVQARDQAVRQRHMALADGAKLQNVRSLPSSCSSRSSSSSSTVPSVPAQSLSTTHSRVAALRKPELAPRQSAAFQCTQVTHICTYPTRQAAPKCKYPEIATAGTPSLATPAARRSRPASGRRSRCPNWKPSGGPRRW